MVLQSRGHLLAVSSCSGVRARLSSCVQVVSHAAVAKKLLSVLRIISYFHLSDVVLLISVLLFADFALSGPLWYYSGEIEMTVAFLVEIDKLVQLLESPIFVGV